MYTFRPPGRDIPKAVALLSWPVLLLISALAPARAFATCIADPDPDVRGLQTLVAQDANRALKQVQTLIDQSGQSSSATQNPGPRMASLYAVEAAAYEILELAAEARGAASEGLKFAADVHDPVHVELLAAYAQNVYDAAGIAAQIKIIEKARRAQMSGSELDTCLLITRGVLEKRQDRADLAIVSLTQAYGASASQPVTEPHILAAAALSAVMRGMGDYAQALALNQEEIDWHTAHGATLSLSVSRFMRGQIFTLMRRYQAAIAEFEQSRGFSVMVNDEEGIAYADLRICEAHIELRELAPARQECGNALHTFLASQSADSAKETQAMLARIDLEEGRADRALATLNGVLDRKGADLQPLHVASLYESRARANAALHKYRDAYSDLREYAQRYVAANDAERQRQADALRARFDIDREIERNASLQRALTLSQEQSNRQARQLRWNAVVVVVGVCVIALLIYFLLSNFRYRQQLVRLASQDGLTGLPNRRRTAELAMAMLQEARAERRPLAIAIIDMDHFKIINDRCGHATGDHVLREFARAGGEALRHTDLLGRWGGEEFLLIMPGAAIEVAVANLERLRTLMFGVRLPAPSGAGLRVSFSAGLAVFDSNVKSLDDLIARADGALYAAKNDGRDLVRIADPSQITGSHAIRRAQRQ